MSLKAYLFIAIGGAIGSLGRAWIGAALSPLTGASFPWPTVLINIAGSFLIAYFGLLTASDSRFAASAELRAFLMVGLCGGFTTFSSFSQQSLDLLRDGRLNAALANIFLSVLLCLIGSAAGYGLASQTRLSPIAAKPETASLAMPLPSVVALHTPQNAGAILRSVDALIGAKSPLEVLTFDPALFGATEALDAVLSPAKLRRLRQSRSRWTGENRERLARWVQERRQTGVHSSWRNLTGDGRTALLERGHTADLVILEHDPFHRDHEIRRISTLFMKMGRAVLLLPDHPPERIGASIALVTVEGYTRETCHFMAPWLGQADHVSRRILPETREGITTLVQTLSAQGTSLIAMALPDWHRLTTSLVDQTSHLCNLPLLLFPSPKEQNRS